MKNKKAYSLIELMVVLSIIFMISTISVAGVKSYFKIINKINVNLCNNSVLAFINNSKMYCRENNVNGKIFFSEDINALKLVCNAKKVSICTFPSNFKIVSINSLDRKIKINNLGMTKSACTIKFEDGKGEIHNITLCVGTAHAQIKN